MANPQRRAAQAERQRLSRQRRNQNQGIRPTPQTNAERQRRYRERQRLQRAEASNQQIRSPTQNPDRDPSIRERWAAASRKFSQMFSNNTFGHACDVCDRLWFKNDLKQINEQQANILQVHFHLDCQQFSVCYSCKTSLRSGRLPTMSTTNGFKYPPKPDHLPPLDPIHTRLVSPRIPFMAIRRLQRDGSYGIIGQVINIPVFVDSMINKLPRQLDQDFAINVSIKRKLIHKSSYLSGFVKKGILKSWLEYLCNQPLYRDITIDWRYLNGPEAVDSNSENMIDEIADDNDNAPLISRQHTLLWNEENVLHLAPGQGSRPLNIIYDNFAEELSFPQIYFGVGRYFNPNISVTPYMIANSEIRRKDRRGCTPEHILYLAMKILRLRVVDGIHGSFRCIRETENISRRMIEDRQFMTECVEKNLAFLKSIPNSAHYWHTRKQDLFAMIRQLGKPTMFLTMSASEVKWADLIRILHKLSGSVEDIELTDPIQQLDRSVRGRLVNEDPVTCCVYFNKLVDVIMLILKAKTYYNPFGKYRVLDYFTRYEFQHRGSPHAHILLWLENDPKELVSENMPRTIQMITDLCSVSEEDLGSQMYGNQIHKHTFTCTKRGEELCRFNIPYWPINETRVLLPMASDDGRLEGYRHKVKLLRSYLETKLYPTIDDFLTENGLNYDTYLDIIRSSLTRPTICFKRCMSEIRTNTFNPWIASTLNSNMDLQFILEEYSCAAYVVEYVNKSNRGLGNLHRELIKLNESHPEMTHERLLKKLGSKILNTVEMSAQEAAWYLLRQPMSEASRDVIYIPTVWPCERQKSYKTKAQMDQQHLGPDSTNIWTKNIFQKYEERPTEFDALCLADFAACYTSRNTNSPNDSGLENSTTEPNEGRTGRFYKRERSRIIRYRNYDVSDATNYRREMVTLFVPFRNEQVEVIDRNNFISLYDAKIEEIAAKLKEYDCGSNIEQLIEEFRLAQVNDAPTVDVVIEREIYVREILGAQEENFDDFDNDRNGQVVASVSTRSNCMTKNEYCHMMRTTNVKQREIILEVIHRLAMPGTHPIQVFFTGPAGCGKTYVLKLIMETFNRYSQAQNSLSNAYIACASTGKAAVNLGGTTVHSAFHITQSRRMGAVARETLHNIRRLFANVQCIIIDEVSMIGNDILHKVNQRLQEITGNIETNYGGMHIIFCGDFRQLPPVNATPVYKASRSHLSGALLWQSLDFFPLEQVMRQSDVAFSNILTKIGDGQKLSIEESQIIESRFRTEQWCDENLKGVVRLFHQNHMVDSFNMRAIQNGEEHLASDLMIGYSNNEELVAARTRLHRMSTMESAGLPYYLKIAVGYPYMLTSNIDIEDGLVNGLIGTLKFIELLPSSSNDQSLTRARVWLEFSESRTGTKARLKHRGAVVQSRGDISESWTPVSVRTASINLGGHVRCKRTQLPLSAACAITIHKSQGGTFDKAVILYDKSQQTQLVYVGFSRVKSLDGLFLINSKNDFTFHHKLGSTAPSIKEIRDEYARLNRHPLKTICTAIQEFTGSISTDSHLIICTINSQSLVAHSADIESDVNITRTDIIVVTETWMDDTSPVTMQGYELVAAKNQANLDSSQSIQRTRRTAGGVAIYRNIERPIRCQPIRVDYLGSRRIRDQDVGDVLLVEVLVNQSFKFILGAVYLHPGLSKTNIELFLYYSLAKYTEATRRLIPDAELDLMTPLMLTGDFNSNVTDDDWLIQFMNREFNMIYVASPGPTTLGNTTIDLTFTRNLNVSCMPFVSYFSYHRPLFNKVSIE